MDDICFEEVMMNDLRSFKTLGRSLLASWLITLFIQAPARYLPRMFEALKLREDVAAVLVPQTELAM